MTDEQFHEHRTMLANRFAAAARGLMDFMGADGTLAAIPETMPQQYAVAGNPTTIRTLLPAADGTPTRRMRHGQRPNEPLEWEREPGEARRWTILLTSSNRGLVGEAGDKFEHAEPQHERVNVVEVVPGIANKAAEEGGLPDSMIHKLAGDYDLLSVQDNGLVELDTLVDFARAAIVADRAARAGASEDDLYQWKWNEGAPPHPFDKEWFLAETVYGDRVVLTPLPKEFTYDYKTADETYIMRDRIKCWAQFPDSEYKEFAARTVATPSTPVGAGVDTPEFRHLFRRTVSPTGAIWPNLIAHIDQHVASQVRAALAKESK